MVVKKKTPQQQKKSNKKQTHYMVLVWRVIKMLAHSFTCQIKSLWYLNPIYVINRRHQRMYFIDENGKIPVKPRLLERMMDLFRSDAKRKKLLLSWLKKKIPYQNITNFSSSWNDGISVCALLEALRPGVCPDYPNMQHHNIITNCRLGIRLAQQCLSLPQNMITPEEMAIADRRTEQKIFHFICAIKWMSEQSCSRKPVVVLSPDAPLKCHVRGSGLCTGVTGRKARFTFQATDISRIHDISVHIQGPRHDVYCERIVNMLNSNLPPNSKTLIKKNNDTGTKQQIPSKLAATEHVHGYLDDGFGNIFLRMEDVDRMANRNSNTKNISFSCQCIGKGTFLFTFIPIFAGIHTISIKIASQHVGDSPFKVKVYQPCDLKQRNINDTNNKLLILDSMSLGSLDEQNNSFSRDPGGMSQHYNHNKINSNDNGKSPRKSERLLKRQFTIRKKRVLRKVITKNGEEISVLVPSVPSRDTSMDTDSDIIEEEARGGRIDMSSDGNIKSPGTNKHESLRGTKSQGMNIKADDGIHPSDTDTDLKCYTGDMQRCLSEESQQIHCLSFLDYNSSESDTQNRLHGCQDILSKDNAISCTESIGPNDSTCCIAKLNSYNDQLPKQTPVESNNKARCHPKLSIRSSIESVDSQSVFSTLSQTCFTSPSTPASEMTSSTCGDVTSSLSNFSLFSCRIDDASPCSSTHSGRDDNSDNQQSQPQDRNGYSINDESVSTEAQIITDIVPGNKIHATALSTDLVSHCVENINKYRSDTPVEKSTADTFISAFSKPGTCTEKSCDRSRLTDGCDILGNMREKYETDGGIGHDRYLHYWLNSHQSPTCFDDEGVVPEQTTHIVTTQCDNTTPVLIPVGIDDSESNKTKRINLPDRRQTAKGKQNGPIPVIGILGASTSDASVPDFPKALNKFHDIEWRDSKVEELASRKSDTAVSNKLQNTTLMMFRTIPSFESALCLPSNMNVVVPTPHREKCTQVTANEIVEATGWTLRVSCLKLIRKRICIKINSEENIKNELKENSCASPVHNSCFRQITHSTTDSRTSILSPDFRVTINDEQFGALRHVDKKAIRQSTTDTVDSGIVDETLRPSFTISVGVNVNTKRGCLSGHKLVHRRPYRGVINLDPKLVRSNSTPDSSIEEERRYYRSSKDDFEGTDSTELKSPPDRAVTTRKYLRYLRKGQSFSLSDSDLNISGILSSKFDPEFSSFAKIAEKIGFLHRFMRHDKISYEDGGQSRENEENDAGKHSYGITETTKTVCNSEKNKYSDAGVYSNEMIKPTKQNLLQNDDGDLREYSSNNHLSPTKGSHIQSQFYDLNDWNLETNNSLNETSLDSFSSSVRSPEDSYRGFGMSKNARNRFLNTVGIFQDSNRVKEKYRYQAESPNKISNEDNTSENDELHTEVNREDVKGLKAHLLSTELEETVHGQINKNGKNSKEEINCEFGVSEERRTDLLQNLQGFQNLENRPGKLHMRMDSVQRSEPSEINQSNTVSKQMEKRHAHLSHEKQLISPRLPMHSISSVAFEVKASALSCVSSLYYLPCYPPFTIIIEKTQPDESRDVEYTGFVDDTGMCDVDMFGMMGEEWLTSYTDQESIDRSNDKVYVEGVGLTQGYVGVKNNFQIWATSDVTGSPTVSIYGPKPHSVIETCVIYTGDGLYEVMYEVTHPGYYIISVKWCDHDLQESPYLCEITY